MKKAKIIISIILIILGAIIILQNTAAVETKILFITITMPRAVLLLITGLVGYALGVITALSLCKKDRE
jgi:uncharacterized integral membrane protein